MLQVLEEFLSEIIQTLQIVLGKATLSTALSGIDLSWLTVDIRVQHSQYTCFDRCRQRVEITELGLTRESLQSMMPAQ